MHSRKVGSTLAFLAIALLLTTCANRDLELFEQVQTFVQPENITVDILWVVDNSDSMEEENARVRAGSSAFIDALVNTNADFQIGVVTQNIKNSAPNESGRLQGTPSILTSSQDAADVVANFNATVDAVQDGVNDGKGCEATLEAARLAVDENLNLNPGFVREDALLAIVILSDEEDASTGPAVNDFCDDFNSTTHTKPANLNTPQDYVGFFQALKGANFTINGIIELTDDALDCADEEAPNLEEAVGLTNGFEASICEADYTDILDQLGVSIGTLSSRFLLDLPADAATLTVTIDGTALTAADFTYNEDTQEVVLNAAPAFGSVVQISYLVETDGLTFVN